MDEERGPRDQECDRRVHPAETSESTSAVDPSRESAPLGGPGHVLVRPMVRVLSPVIFAAGWTPLVRLVVVWLLVLVLVLVVRWPAEDLVRLVERVHGP